MNRRITEEEVQKLYEEYHTPANVIAHCRAVTDIAEKVAEELNKAGYSLDLSLIEGAGMTHDVARTMSDHGSVGADALEQLGFEDEASIVRCHMFYSFPNSVENLTECDLICLGDRLAVENRYAGLDARIEYVLNKAPKEEHIVRRILEAKAKTAALIKDIEDVLGKTIDSIMTEDINQE